MKKFWSSFALLMFFVVLFGVIKFNYIPAPDVLKTVEKIGIDGYNLLTILDSAFKVIVAYCGGYYCCYDNHRSKIDES